MLIGEIPKNATEKIRVNLSEYKGYRFVDIRIYFADDSGEWKPTKKGVTITKDGLDTLIKLLNEGKKKL